MHSTIICLEIIAKMKLLNNFFTIDLAKKKEANDAKVIRFLTYSKWDKKYSIYDLSERISKVNLQKRMLDLEPIREVNR